VPQYQRDREAQEWGGTVSVRLSAAAYRKLEELRKRLGFSSVSDLVLMLVYFFEGAGAGEEAGREAARGGGGRRRTAAKAAGQRGSRGSGGAAKAIEILREQKVIRESAVARKLRNRDAFFSRLEGEGAVVLKLYGERIAVEREFWKGFVEKLGKVQGEDAEKELDEKERELFWVLKSKDALIYDAQAKAWRLTLKVT